MRLRRVSKAAFSIGNTLLKIALCTLSVSEAGRNRQELNPGDFALTPAYVEHQEVNDGDQEVEWIIARSGKVPMLEDIYQDGERAEGRRHGPSLASTFILAVIDSCLETVRVRLITVFFRPLLLLIDVALRICT